MSKRSKKQDIPENMKWEGEKNLKFIAKRHDKRFGDISIYQNNRTNSKVMCKEKASGDKTQFGKDINIARQRMTMQNQYLHKMLGWSTQTKKELCSTHHYVKMFYEYPGSDLRNETAQRKKVNNTLTENELSSATSNSLNGLDFLHNKKLAHGDIRPQLIGANRMNSGQEVNKFELLDRLADPSPLTKCQINNMMNNKELYMSPQLWKHINTKGKKKPAFDRQKNDLFALGMSVLSAGNQASMKNCYKKGGNFDANALNAHLKNFGDRYGHNRSLTNVVGSLVTLDEANRPSTNLMLQRGYDDNVDVVKHDTFDDVPFHHEQDVNAHLPPAPAPGPPEPVQDQGQDQGIQVRFEKRPMNDIAKDVEIKNKAPAQQSKVVTGDTFFSNPTPVYQPYTPTTYMRAKIVEPAYTAPTVTKYVQEPTHTYVEPTPQTTYVEHRPETRYVQSTPQTNYVEHRPETTYVQSTPQTTYVEHRPETTYVQSTPTHTTYVEQAPQTTYVEHTPQTTYVQSTPTHTTYTEKPIESTYVQTPVKSEYRSSQPTTVNSEGSNITYGTPRVVRKYVDHSSRRSFRGEDQGSTTNFTVQKDPHVEQIVSSYSQPQTTYVQSQPQTTTTYVESQPQTTTTYVQSQPQTTTTYVQSQPHTTTTVHQGETIVSSGYSESHQQPSYHVSKKKSTTFHDAQFDEVRNNGTTVVRSDQYENGYGTTTVGQGKVVTRKVTVKDSEGNIIEQYDEPVDQ